MDETRARNISIVILLGFIIIGAAAYFEPPSLTVTGLDAGTSVVLDGAAIAHPKPTITIKVSRGSDHRLAITGEDAISESITFSLQPFGRKTVDGSLSDLTSQLHSQNPLLKYLPENTADFSIWYSISASKVAYHVELHGVPLPTFSHDIYVRGVTVKKNDALNWIKSKSVDPTKLNITWDPVGAKDL